MSDEGNRLACMNVQIDPLKGCTARLIFKADILKSDIPTDRRNWLGICAVLHQRLFVQIFEDTLGGSHSHQQLVVCLTQPVDRVPEVADIGAEGHQYANRQASGLNEIGPEPEQDQRSKPSSNLDNWPEPLVERRCLVPGLFAVFVHRIKVEHILMLLGIGLGYPYPLNRLIQMGIDP
ncbi:hypothetical protein D3C71_1301340 [compost metagenome]